MVVADALSHRPNHNKGSADNEGVIILKPECICGSFVNFPDSPFMTDIKRHVSQMDKMWAKHGNSPGWSRTGSVLCWYNHVWVPDKEDLCKHIIKTNHNSRFAGHPG